MKERGRSEGEKEGMKERGEGVKEHMMLMSSTLLPVTH